MGQETEEERTVSHLCRACGLWSHAQELGNKAALGNSVFEQAAQALIGLDHDGRVVEHNTAAEAMFRERDCIELQCGHLHACMPCEADSLRSAVRRVAQYGVAATLSISGVRSGPHACFLRIARMHQGKVASIEAGVASLLVIASPKKDKARLNPELLHEVFGLTRSESAVALALVEGMTPEEYAQKTSHSMPTVRTQLRAVYQKTNTRRQAETVRLLLRVAL